MADLIIRGLSLRERDEVNHLARRQRKTQTQWLRELIRKAIGSTDKTVRKHEEPTITERLAVEWAIPGREELEGDTRRRLVERYGARRAGQLMRKWARERAEREAAWALGEMARALGGAPEPAGSTAAEEETTG